MKAKTWTDQPNVVAECKVLCEFLLHADQTLSVEVRYNEVYQRWFVTAGNLFHSQTVECEGHLSVFAAIQHLAHTAPFERGKLLLPQGIRLVTES